MFGVSVGFQGRVRWTEERVQGRAGRFEGRMARQLGDSAGCQNLCPFLRPTSFFVQPPPTLLLFDLSPPFSHPSSSAQLTYSLLSPCCFSSLLLSFLFNSNRSRCVFLSPYDRIRKESSFSTSSLDPTENALSASTP